MSDESVNVRLSAQRALWGHVPPCLRAVSIQKEGDLILWRCVFDTDATEDDFELARMAGTEIIADFPAPTTIEEQIVTTRFAEKPQHLEHLVYLRHEHNHYRAQA